MSAVGKLITRIEQQAERVAGYQQLEDRAFRAVKRWDKARQAYNAAEKKFDAAMICAGLVETTANLETLRGQLGELAVKRLNAAESAVRAFVDLMEAREAEERVWPGKTRGCDAPDAMADEILHLRQQLAEAQQPDVDAMRSEVERLRAFVGKVRAARDCYEWPQSWHRIEAALSELDAQPAPVADTAEDGT